jgi:hypothetical protein
MTVGLERLCGRSVTERTLGNLCNRPSRQALVELGRFSDARSGAPDL